MTPPDSTRPLSLEQKALIWLLVLFSAGFVLILWPLAGAVLWAIFIAIVFFPMHERATRLIKRRPTITALATMSVIVIIVILPLGLLTASVVDEATRVYEQVRSGEIQFGQYFQRGLDALPGWLRGLLDRFGLGDLPNLQAKISAAIARSGQAITSQVVSIGQGTLDFVLAFFVMLYILFFLLRDGKALVGSMARAVPLQQRHTQRLFTQFATVVRATVKGNIVVALIQGALGGLAFWFLDLPGPLLWGALMAILSLLPAVGAALVWGPVAIYFLLAGQLWQAIALAIWGVLVIGLVDNVLRPILVGKDTRMPDYLVLVTTLGGIAIFGLNGFVIGPVIAAMFLVAWDIFAQERRGEPASAPDEPPTLDAPPRRRRRRRPPAS